MPLILLKINNVQKEDLVGHEDVISQIAYPGNQCAQAKMLRGVTYQGLPVYRVKTNKKERIVYTYIDHPEGKVLLILAYMEDHNYPKLNRQLQGLDAYIKQYQKQDNEEPDKKSPVADNKDEKRAKLKLDWVPVTYYNKMHIAHDEQQSKALGVELPLLLSGPPGSGKTGVIYTLLLKTLNMTATAAPETAAAPRAKSKYPIYFVSASQQLIATLEKTHESLSSSEVNFTTWNALLLKHYHPVCKLVDDEVFAKWSTDLFPKESSQTVHYELSLYAALGEDKYLGLKPRQSHFSGKKEQQRLIGALHTGWVKYLNDNKLVDPMVSMLPKKGKFIIYCDEAQNLPPTALRSLMEHTVGRNFIACLDSEQCLYASSFIANCLKELLHQHFDHYTNHSLARSWRCPPKVTTVTTHILNLKHTFDGFQDRRPYSFIESVQKEPGVASWVKAANYSKLQQYGVLAGTVVIVTQKPDATERALINKELGSNNIITAEEAIGLDFSTVILWKPVTATLREAITKKSVNEEQKRAFHALFVGCSRAQKSLFVCDARPEFIPRLFGNTLDDNAFDVCAKDKKESAEQQKQKWETQVQYYLDLNTENSYEQAGEIMSFHLKLSLEMIKKRIADAKSVHSKPTLQDHKSNDDSKGKKADKIVVKKEAISKIEAPPAIPVVAKKTPLSEEELKKKRTLYITGLLAAPSAQNIMNLLQFDNTKLAKILFEHSLHDGKNLFVILISNRNISKIISANIRPDFIAEYLKRIISIKGTINPYDRILLDWILSNNAGLKCLFEYKLTDLSDQPCLFQQLVQIPQIRQVFFSRGRIGLLPYLTKKLLSYTHPEHAKKSVFYWLTRTDDGRNFILEQSNMPALNPGEQILNNIDAAMLCQCSPDNDSPLYWLLTDDSCGRGLLEALFENPAILNGITTDALCLPLAKDLGEDAFVNHSSLSMLVKGLNGVELLYKLISKNKSFAKKITGVALCRGVSEGCRFDGSPLFHLALPINQMTLSLLLDKNPSLYSTISAEALFFQIPQPEDIKEDEVTFGYSIFYFLSVTNAGASILFTILSRKPEMYKNITSDVLLIESSHPMSKKDKSARDWLKEWPRGRRILADLPAALVNSPNITQEQAKAKALASKSLVVNKGLFALSAAAPLAPTAAAATKSEYDHKF